MEELEKIKENLKEIDTLESHLKFDRDPEESEIYYKNVNKQKQDKIVNLKNENIQLAETGIEKTADSKLITELKKYIPPTSWFGWGRHGGRKSKRRKSKRTKSKRRKSKRRRH